MHALIQGSCGEAVDMTGFEKCQYNLGFMVCTVLLEAKHNSKFLLLVIPLVCRVSTFLAKLEEKWRVLAKFRSSFGEFHSKVGGNPGQTGQRFLYFEMPGT